MDNKKKTGSYYTPTRLANLVTDYCLVRLAGQADISIIEPSVGDGAFLSSISNSVHLPNFNSVNLTIVEKNEEEINKALQIPLNPNIQLQSFNEDYLEFHFRDNNRYSLYLGNPPYVKKTLLDEEHKNLAKLIHAEKLLSDKSINNIWTSFVVSGVSKLADNGMMALILPLELLQVKFTEEIRNLLKAEFQRMEIFTFNELQFQECKGQDTVLLIGYKQHENAGTFYTNISSLDDLENGNYVFNRNTAVSDSDKKWTHHLITPEEYEFLESIKSRLNLVSHHLNNKPGIVTAANKFFIVNRDTVEQFNLHNYIRPIVQKGFFVNGSISFNDNNFQNLVNGNKPAYLLDFNPMEDNQITEDISTYLAAGVEMDLPNGFKCKQRNKWYQVNNIAEIPAAFFFKRAHEYPKLIRNDANVLVTDSAYKIEMINGFELNNFIYSFYNSLTLAYAELEGRYYGGGVLELTPNEFRILPVPYTVCNNFAEYEIAFANKNSIQDVLTQNNYAILNGSLGLSVEEINRIELIRQQLINKRQRN
ncbi:N-6 DNA methylase [Flavobacterium sp. CYK-4]|uniref:Eco57I restriction-modification methylase domain-containing protein n=1 Tax=Flavobacterium lotistagni TaxID=2709660 RepID=UPI0014097C08|nr:N-6 DNA methylase [Flavobacterium lotistagni]NHM07612.1 N-6 DNA methylase [Flavobacterium lotistagni]